MQISENRYKVMLNKFKEQAEKLEVLEMENEKYVNEIINQNVVIMKQSDIINATSELLTNEVKWRIKRLLCKMEIFNITVSYFYAKLWKILWQPRSSWKFKFKRAIQS